MRIKNITALEILDSRGTPTLKTMVQLDNGIVGWAAVPSGASTGVHEALEIRDNDPKRYAGKGVLMAKHNVESIIAELVIGQDSADQEKIDRIMIEADGTDNKAKLGANAILSVSLAVARAAASAQHKELYQYLKKFFNTSAYTLPVPFINVINGGKHAEQSTDFQEYMLIPHGFSKFSEALRAAAEVFINLKKKLSSLKQPTTVGDEGGFAPRMANNSEPIQLLTETIEETGYMMGGEFLLGLDTASSEFYENDTYVLAKENQRLNRDELLAYYQKLKENNPYVVSIEDGFAEDDWQGFTDMTRTLGDKIQIVGDDLYATRLSRLEKGIGLRATNAILVKLNQIGTLTETIEVIKKARNAHMEVIISHRSGETEDPFIADLAVASNAGQIKTGSLSRSERLVKYNRLIEIEHYEQHASYYQFPYTTNGNGY